MNFPSIPVNLFPALAQRPVRRRVCGDRLRSAIATIPLVGAQDPCAPFQQDRSATETRLFRYN
jgi:hypothetical protein